MLKHKLLIQCFLIFATFFTIYWGSSQKIRAAADDFILSWSSDSYAPQNYEGKALPSRGSAITAAVLPTKKLSPNPDALYYRWLLDNDMVYAARGQGKSSFSFTATKWGGDVHEVETQILDAQENFIWRGRMNIKIASPQILIETAANHYALPESSAMASGKDFTLNAIPLFFNAKTPRDLLFQWSFDGSVLNSSDGAGDKKPEQLTIKIPKSNLAASIFKSLSLFIQNKNDHLQQSRVNLEVEIK